MIVMHWYRFGLYAIYCNVVVFALPV